MGILKTLTINGTTYNVTAAVPAANVTLLASAWKSDGEAYSQVVDIPGVTAHTKVDLQPTSEQLVDFHSKDLAFVAENDGGTVTVFAIGDKPAGDHTIQITKTEVDGAGKIRGNTVGTTIKPEKALVKATNLNEEEKAQARDNIGAAEQDQYGLNVYSSYTGAKVCVEPREETNETGYVTNLLLHFLGAYGDEPVKLRGLAPGTEERDAVTLGQVMEMLPNAPIRVVSAPMSYLSEMESGIYYFEQNTRYRLHPDDPSTAGNVADGSFMIVGNRGAIIEAIEFYFASGSFPSIFAMVVDLTDISPTWQRRRIKLDELYGVFGKIEGIETAVGNIETALDSIIAIQENLIGGAAE